MPDRPSPVPNLFCEIDDAMWRVVAGARREDIALERKPNGNLTDRSRSEVAGRLREIVGATGSRKPQTALCAIGARGVTLRRMSLPPSRPEDRDKVLALQIEREFPIAPANLAWGHRALGLGSGGGGDILVAAVRKEQVDEYAAIAAEAGITMSFTLAIMAICASSSVESGALLNVGIGDTEIAILDGSLPLAMRTVGWGTMQIRAGLMRRLDGNEAAANELSAALVRGESVPEAKATLAADVIREGARRLADGVRRNSAVRRVSIAGELAAVGGLVEQLKRELGDEFQVERLDEVGQFRALTPLAALQSLREADRLDQLLILQPAGAASEEEGAESGFPYQWIAVAAALLVGLFVFRYAVPLTKGPALEKKLEEVRAARAALPPIEQEVDFLRAVEKSQPAYLNALAVLADATPRGTKVESISLNQRGEFSFEATMPGAQQANELRTKLIDSGMFSNAAIEEQTPEQNQRQVKVRIRARWNPSPELTSPVLDRISANAKTNAPSKGGEG